MQQNAAGLIHPPIVRISVILCLVAGVLLRRHQIPNPVQPVAIIGLVALDVVLAMRAVVAGLVWLLCRGASALGKLLGQSVREFSRASPE